MGLVRKTMSVGTLGLVSFRSKKEKLRRAEFSQHDAEAALEREHEARLTAEVRSIAAEKRVQKAKAEAARANRKADKRGGRRRHKSDRLAGLVAGAEPMVRSGVETAIHVGHDAAQQGRKVGRRARKAAERSAVDARKAAERGRKVGRRASKAAKHTAVEAMHAAEHAVHQAAEVVSSSK